MQENEQIPHTCKVLSHILFKKIRKENSQTKQEVSEKAD